MAPLHRQPSAEQQTQRLATHPIHRFSRTALGKRMSAYWRSLGPGLTTGAADDDPSGVTTYSQAGSQFGFQLLWLAVLTLPMMAVVQEMCARIGMVTGQGLAANIRKHFPRLLLSICTALLLVANIFNIGADLGAMTAATQLVLPGIPFALLVVVFALLSLVLLIVLSYHRYAKMLKWLSFALLAYVVTAFTVSGIDWAAALRQTFLPLLRFDGTTLILISAVLGTTISPYLFFWQTSQEVEEEVNEGRTTIAARRNASAKELRSMRGDVWSGMTFSNIVMFFIIVTCAATLNANGVFTITSAVDAAAALRPLAGNSASLLFALGIVGTGLLAVPVLAGSAAYALSESFGWKEGLFRKLKEATAFYGIIIVATAVGLLLVLLGLDPIRSLIAAAVINGVVAPVILVFVVLLGSSKAVMGSRVNGWRAATAGWTVVALMALAAIGALVAL